MVRLNVVVLAAGSVTLLCLAAQLIRARAFGRRRLFAAPASDPAAGVRYAFTKAMLPQAKESVMMNLPSYAAGMVFHTGVFVAFGLLATAVAGLTLPDPVAWTVRGFTAIGSLGGLVLLVKRLVKPHLRGLSRPDDFVSNLLTTGFVAFACGASFIPLLTSAWLASATVLLLYIPMGKIRHCVFFFTSRYHLGAFFGRRGTFPTVR
jgi:hypothetical protein